MFIDFDKEFTQKNVFFGLKNSFRTYRSETVSGIYFITNDNNEVSYIGQSKNIASRLSTHLTEKYTNARCIYIMEFDESQLNEAESYLINKLKPADNIIIPEIELKNDYKNSEHFKENYDFFISVRSRLLIPIDFYYVVDEIIKYDNLITYDNKGLKDEY